MVNYKYKLRNQLGFTGVTLFDEGDLKESLDTMSAACNNKTARKESRQLAKQLNEALERGREEVLRNVTSYLGEIKSAKLESLNLLEKMLVERYKPTLEKFRTK
jgi:hypothetical protein